MGWFNLDIKQFIEAKDGFELTCKLQPSEKHNDKVSGELTIYGRFVSV